MPARKTIGSHARQPAVKVLTPQQASQLTAQLRAAISGGTPCNTCVACSEYGAFMAGISNPRTRPRAAAPPACVAQPVPA